MMSVTVNTGIYKYFMLGFIFSFKKKVKGGSSRTLPSAGSTPTREPTMQSAAPEPTEAIGWAVVKYNYTAQQMDELSLTKGKCYMIL